MKKKSLLAVALALALSLYANGQRYCNPLPMPIGSGGNAAGDVTVVDMTNNKNAKDTIFDEFDPVNCRFVRLTVTDWPKENPLGIIDFTVFGYPEGIDASAVATPVFSNLPLDTVEKERRR